MKKLFILILISMLTACGGMKPVDPQILANADYGSYPTNYKEAIKAYYSTKLKDPFSAQYQINKPYKGYLRSAPITGGKPTHFGYLVKLSINAKNSYGAYIGWRERQIFLRDGVVISEPSDNPWFE